MIQRCRLDIMVHILPQCNIKLKNAATVVLIQTFRQSLLPGDEIELHFLSSRLANICEEALIRFRLPVSRLRRCCKGKALQTLFDHSSVVV